MAKREKKLGKLSGLKEDGTPNAHWLKFHDRLYSEPEIPLSQWKNEHFLGLILRKIKSTLNESSEYPLSYIGAPGKCQEMYAVNRMILSLGSTDPEYIKAYIDWIFDNEIIPKKIIVKSIAYFFTAPFILKFKEIYKKNNKVSRASVIPLPFKSIADSAGVEISTYGDLAFAKMAVDQDPENEEYIPYINLFEKFRENGFDFGKLACLD
jgi:hypothetical protein